MNIKTALFKTAALEILLAGFILIASSCASTKPDYQRRNSSGPNNTSRSVKQESSKELPVREAENWERNRQATKGPYKPQQDNYQQQAPASGQDRSHDNGLGEALSGVLQWLLNGFSSGRQ